MKRTIKMTVAAFTLLGSLLNCALPGSLGVTPSATPGQKTITPAPSRLSTAAPLEPTATVTAEPTLQPTPTTAPSPTPIPPPEEITTANVDRLNLRRTFGSGALVKVKVSPDGKTLLLAYTTDLVMMNMTDLKPAWRTDPGRFLTDITFSKDGSALVSTTLGGTGLVHNAVTGALIGATVQQREGVTRASLSPFGGVLAVTDYSGTTAVHDVQTGKEIQSNNGQAYPAGGSVILVSPDESVFVMEGFDSKLTRQVQQWNVSDGAYKIGLIGVPQEMTGWRYSTDGKRIYGVNVQKLTAKDSTVLSAWDSATGRFLKNLSTTDLLVDYISSPDSKTLLLATRDRVLKVIDAESGAVRGSYTDHTAEIAGMAFTPDGQTVISVDVGGNIRIWDVFTQKTLREAQTLPVTRYVNSPISANIRRAAVLAPGGKKVEILDTATWKSGASLGDGQTEYTALAISSQGSLAAARDQENRISVWEVETGKLVQRLETKTRFPIKKLKFSPDEQLISSLSAGQILTWKVVDGKKLPELAGFNDFDYSPDSATLVSDSTDYGLYFSSVQTGKRLASTKGDFISALAYSPSGTLVAVGGTKVQPVARGLVNLITLVDAKTQTRQPVEMPEAMGTITGIAYLPNAPILASSDSQGNIVFWNANTGEALKGFEEAVCPPADVRFSPDGSLLVVGGGDGTFAVISTYGSAAAAPVAAPAQATPGAAPAPVAVETSPYTSANGLITASLPADWKKGDIDVFTIQAMSADTLGMISISAINTGLPMEGDFFKNLVGGLEQYFLKSTPGYQETANKIDAAKGEAFVSKRMSLDGRDYNWETYYKRDGVLVYWANFISAASQGNAYIKLYQKVYASIQVDRKLNEKQMPFGILKKVDDPQGEYVYKYPLGWLNTPIAGDDGKNMGDTYVSPDGKAYFLNLLVDIPESGDRSAAFTETASIKIIKSTDANATILKKEKTPQGDLRISFKTPKDKNTGVMVTRLLAKRLHIFYVIYGDSVEKTYKPLQERLLEENRPTAAAPGKTPAAATPGAAPAQATPGATPAPVSEQTSPYTSPNGLITASLPADWKKENTNDFTIQAVAADTLGMLLVSAINTGLPMEGDFFKNLVGGFEQSYLKSSEGYKETSSKIDTAKGEAYVAKRVSLAGQDYIWETYYTRDGVLVYQANYMSAASQGTAYVKLYQKVNASIKVDRKVNEKQTPFGILKKVDDPQGEFVFKFPAGWANQPIAGDDGKNMGDTYVSPDGKSYFLSLLVDIPEGGDRSEAFIESASIKIIKSVDANATILKKEKTPEGDLKISFKTPKDKNTGVMVTRLLTKRLHVFYVIYGDSVEKTYKPLQERLLAENKRK